MNAFWHVKMKLKYSLFARYQWYSKYRWKINLKAMASFCPVSDKYKMHLSIMSLILEHPFPAKRSILTLQPFLKGNLECVHPQAISQVHLLKGLEPPDLALRVQRFPHFALQMENSCHVGGGVSWSARTVYQWFLLGFGGGGGGIMCRGAWVSNVFFIVPLLQSGLSPDSPNMHTSLKPMIQELL